MAKAQITFQDGTTVKLEGTPAEISAVINSDRGVARAGPSKAKEPPSKPKKAAERVTLVDLIGNLIAADFFKSPRGLSAIRGALVEMGYHYPVTSLSGVMLRQVRKRNIRRIRHEKHWAYTR